MRSDTMARSAEDDPAVDHGVALFTGTAYMSGMVPCATCHTVTPGGAALSGPNLAGIAQTAATRIHGVSAADYLRLAILAPDAYVVDGYVAGQMNHRYADLLQTGILTDADIDALVAYLLTLDASPDQTQPLAASRTPVIVPQARGTGPIIASTTWTAAFARAAGANPADIVTIAPGPDTMRRPLGYVMTDDDSAKLNGARLVILMGCEEFATTLLAAADRVAVPVVIVTSRNGREIIRADTALIAQALGTTAANERWMAGFDRLLDDLQAEIAQALPADQRQALVHHFQLEAAEDLGFTPLVAFGPAPLPPDEIRSLAALRPPWILDNYHTVQGTGISAAAPDAHYVQLINFPGIDGTVTLEDVYRANADRILAAITSDPASGQSVQQIGAVAEMVLGVFLTLAVLGALIASLTTRTQMHCDNEVGCDFVA